MLFGFERVALKLRKVRFSVNIQLGTRNSSLSLISRDRNYFSVCEKYQNSGRPRELLKCFLQHSFGYHTNL